MKNDVVCNEGNCRKSSQVGNGLPVAQGGKGVRYLPCARGLLPDSGAPSQLCSTSQGLPRVSLIRPKAPGCRLLLTC